MDDIQLRRALLEKEYGFLNEEQRKAVFQLEGPLLVLAGAGSGKTSVLTNRIAYMIKYGDAYNREAAPVYSDAQRQHLQDCLENGLDDGARDLLAQKPVSPYNILAITFTNKAAGEMRERVEKLAGVQGAAVWVSTFHSACCRILRRDIEKLGYSRSFTIYDDEDQLSIIKESLRELNLSDKEYTPREIKGRISQAKMQMLTPDEAFANSNRDFRSQKIYDVYGLYEGKLKKNSALDFDDLLLKTLQLFADHPPVLEYYARRFEYIMVDEYQDTNRVQYMFIHLLAKVHGNLCVVGDDDQSIYGWRGADISNILDFEKDYKNCTVIKLEQNYRSTNTILNAANAVINNNMQRKEKELWSDKGEGQQVTWAKLNDEQEEASYVCEEIFKLRQVPIPYHEIAILYRTNAQSRVLEERLVFSGIPYSVYGGLRFYERKEIKDAVCYLRLCVNPSDEVALRRVINEPRRGIGDATVEALSAWALASGDTLLGAAMDVDEVETLNARAKTAVKKFSGIMGELLAMKEVLPVSQFAEKVIELSGIREQYNKDDDEARARYENLGELLGAIYEYERSVENPTIEGYLEEAALVADIDALTEESGRVTLMTMHSAKGLEFSAVFVTGMEEGLFPGSRSIFEPEKMEEERRLCYVAITRAKERLYFTNVARRMIYGSPQHNKPSRFIDEVPENLVEQVDRTSAWRRDMQRTRAVRPPKEFSRGGIELHISQAEETPKGNGNFALGDRVEHARFGEGTVVKMSGTVAHVAFPGLGIKELDVRFAPMKAAK